MGDSRDPYAAHQPRSQLHPGQRRPNLPTVADAITQLTEDRRYDHALHALHALRALPHVAPDLQPLPLTGQADLSHEKPKTPGQEHPHHRTALNTSLAPQPQSYAAAVAQLALTLDISNPGVSRSAHHQPLSDSEFPSFHPPLGSFGRPTSQLPVSGVPVSPPPRCSNQLGTLPEEAHRPTKRHPLPSGRSPSPRKRRLTIADQGTAVEAAAHMPFMTSDLAILNAEQYNDGVPFASPRAAKKAPLPAASVDDGSGPRKRAKTKATVSAGEGEEEEKKKARGRPRLDTKDETAAERRRTQIRLAQRAYRNRKENAITTLEKQVQDLRDTNDEMSNEFMRLHDFALSQGLLERMPEFGRQLRASTERFLALSQRSHDDASRGGGDGESAKSPDGKSTRTGSTTAISALEPPPPPPPPPDAADAPSPPLAVPETAVPLPPPATKVHGWGGYIVSHDSSNQAEDLADFSLTASLPTLSPPTTTSAAFDFEVIAQPTFENASFPFLMPGSDSPPSPLSGFFEPSPYPTMPSPKTYAAFETTFGRRLQRVAIERAYALITAPNPDPVRFARVFGFCSVFEPIDKIRDRLRSGLDRSRQETLNYWQYPFVNLGGAGTHFPGLDDLPTDGTTTTTTTISSSSGPSSGAGTPYHPIGNQGTLEPLRPRFGTGFSSGPFTSGVASARDTKLGPRLRIMMPGFEGSFYDCDEIELYLQQRGVDIPAGADTVVADVDMAAFHDDNDTPNIPGTDAPGGLFGPSSAEIAAVVGLEGLEAAAGFGGHGEAAASTGWPAGVASGLFSFGGLAHDITATLSTRKLVTLDVNVLVKELVERATCLGRTPGFRQSDVNAAFWIATR